jgi:hypothetical protein
MGRTLDTIIEVDVSDDDMAYNANKRNMKSTCKAYNILESATLGKEIDDGSFFGQFANVLEICEPDSELDPEEDLSLPLLKEALKLALSSTKSRKKKSLIDKAFTHQQGQQLQDAHADVKPQHEPAYIRLADLAADWSCYIPKPVPNSPQNPMPVGTFVRDGNVQSTVDQPQEPGASQAQTASGLVSSTPKRSNRKKSLIDKAASRQRKELAAQGRQPESQEMKAMSSQETKTTYCSLCEDGIGRKNRSSCGLCNSRV